MKTGSDSIEAIMCRRWILFAGFVARMADTRLTADVRSTVRDVRRADKERGLRGEAGK